MDSVLAEDFRKILETENVSISPIDCEEPFI
jgi:hypothetical protein